jgi:hypothetical protein
MGRLGWVKSVNPSRACKQAVASGISISRCKRGATASLPRLAGRYDHVFANTRNVEYPKAKHRNVLHRLPTGTD